MSNDYKRVVLVTGSNTGIGFAIVKQLAEKGQILYLAARNEVAGKEAQKKLKNEHNLDVKFVHLNVEDVKSIEAARDAIDKAEGRLDVLINNAGIAGFEAPQNPEGPDMKVMRAVFETNVFGVIQTTIGFLPLLRKAPKGYGHIIQNSMQGGSLSMMSKPNPFKFQQFSAYCTSKAALGMYSVTLAYQLQEDKIRVNLLCPGFVTTKLNGYSAGGKTTEEGAKIFVDWAMTGPEDGRTGKFWGDEGEVPW